MVREGVCTLVVECSTAPQHFPIVEAQAVLSSEKALLLKLQVQGEHESGETLSATACLPGLKLVKMTWVNASFVLIRSPF